MCFIGYNFVFIKVVYLVDLLTFSYLDLLTYYKKAFVLHVLFTN